ncbi:MAG: helix-turn-helix transcriptional regulator [Oscillospiraceae bacterium]|jgi:transcriptional regulator with XRE-family HTH domain|nr:helix-turn-helix transcriptional regulator [Oscillospiraceae bacterium]
MTIQLPENLKKLRRVRELTQEELAERLGVSPQSISKWERGDNSPDIYMLPLIANFFEVSVDELLGMEIIRDEKRVEDAKKWTREYHSQAHIDTYEPVLELWEELARERPHNWDVQYEYAGALLGTQGGKSPEEQEKLRRAAIAVFRRILENSADPELRANVSGNLIFYLQTLYEFDEARELIDKTPRIDQSRLRYEVDHALAVLRKYNADNDYTTPERCKQIDPDKARELIAPFKSATAQYMLLATVPFSQYLHWAKAYGLISVDEYAELAKLRVPFQQITMLDDITPQSLTHINSYIAIAYIEAGDIDKALDYFEAEIEADLTVDWSLTSETVRQTVGKDGSLHVERFNEPLRAQLIRGWEESKAFDPIKNEPRFKTALEKLSADKPEENE